MVKLGRLEPPQPTPQLPNPAQLSPWGIPGVDWGGGEGRGGGPAQQGARSHNRRRGGGTFSSPSSRDPQSNTHTQSSACKLQLGPLQLSRVAPWSGAGDERWLAGPHGRRQVCLVGPIAVFCTPQHTPCWQGGQGGLMRENVRKECVRAAVRACMGPHSACSHRRGAACIHA